MTDTLWPQVDLGKVAWFQEGPGILAKDFRTNGIPLVRLSGLGGHQVTLKGCNFVDGAKVSKTWDHFRLVRGDIVISTSASFGRPAVVSDQAQGAIFYTGLIRFRPSSNDLDAGYLKTFLGSREFMLQAVAQASGSVIQHFGPSHLRRMQITLPPIEEQRRIAEVHSRLDDKIELNRRMNETLEGMAQAIFQDWFVDFGPTRRKAAGEANPVAVMGGLTPDPARAAHLAALFSAAFGEDDLPLGWSETSIGDLVKIQGGSTPSTADESLWFPGLHHWATPKDLSNMNDLALFGSSRQISDAGLAKITSGLLPVGAVLLSSRAPIGYLAIAQVPVAINQGFIGLLPTAEIGSAYLCLWCKANMDKITANANGSTFQEISKRNFRPITSAVPTDRRIIAEFGEIATPLIDRIVAAAKENQILAKTRDYLLPRLMSGEARVAPQSVERA